MANRGERVKQKNGEMHPRDFGITLLRGMRDYISKKDIVVRDPVRWFAENKIPLGERTLTRRLKTGGWLYAEVKTFRHLFQEAELWYAVAIIDKDFQREGEEQ